MGNPNKDGEAATESITNPEDAHHTNRALARREKHGMNEERKELTVEFLMNQLAIEDCNAHHKSLSQLDSTTSVNFAAYDCIQNRGKSNKQK